MHVHVEEYNAEWPGQSISIQNNIQQILINIPYRSIEYVGSTSVPGPAAKPLIHVDIIIEQDVDV
jgi:GrpB-like predicted nucleotidyltransferase (UPF0157 family)